MDKKVTILLLFLIVLVPVPAQTENKTQIIETDAYRIEYPASWQLDQSGRNKTEFIILSKREENDPFRENINLIAQDLSKQIMNLDSYVALSENQIKTGVPGSKLSESKRVKKNGLVMQQLIWSGVMNNKVLKFKQLLFVENNVAYVLTLTCEEKQYDNYIGIANQIFNSFTLK